MWRIDVAAICCLVIFHSPDGKEIPIETRHIVALRSAEGAVKGHVAQGINTIVYTGAQNFGIAEDIHDAKALIEECTEN